jgi:hypothetical protein
VAKRQPWTPQDVDTLRQHYENTPTKVLAERLGRNVASLWHKARSIGLSKSIDLIRKMASEAMKNPEHGGRKAQFQRGLTPWNKGISFDSGGRSYETRFKPGQKPHTWNPIGHERISDLGYLQRKMTDTGVTRRDYVAVHHLVWQEAGREIPKGFALTFKDGNKRNFALDNLELVSRADLMRRNSYHNYGPEVAQLVQLRGAITRQINKRITHEQSDHQ